METLIPVLLVLSACMLVIATGALVVVAVDEAYDHVASLVRKIKAAKNPKDSKKSN